MVQNCVKVYHGLTANINQSTCVLKSKAIACDAKVKECDFPVSRPQLVVTRLFDLNTMKTSEPGC